MNTPALNPDRIGDAGRQLYGDHWQAPLSKALGIDPRLLRYWLNGSNQPSRDKLQALIALLEASASRNYELADYLRTAAELVDVDDVPSWTFGKTELHCLNRTTVEHIPTGSKIYFYEYVEEPPQDYVPGGTIMNAGLFSGQELTRFNVAAWALLAKYRYGEDIQEVRRVIRGSIYKMPVADILRTVRRSIPSLTEERLRTALNDMVQLREIQFIGRHAIERLRDPSPLFDRE